MYHSFIKKHGMFLILAYLKQYLLPVICSIAGKVGRLGVSWIAVAEINWLALSEVPRKQINSMWLLTTQGPTCLWEV